MSEFVSKERLYQFIGQRGVTRFHVSDVDLMPAEKVVPTEDFENQKMELEKAKACINEAYWVAWARDFQEPGTPGNERLHAALQDVMLALKGQIHTRPERADAVRTAEKELARVERSLAGAKKRGVPPGDVENLEKKVAYKRLVTVLVKGTDV